MNTRPMLVLFAAFLLSACNTTKTPDAKDNGPPATPVLTSVIPGNAQLSVQWQANTEADLDHYVLRWGTNPEQLTNTENVQHPQTGHMLEGLSNKTTYHLALEAVDQQGNTSGLSTLVSATPDASAEPPALEPPALEPPVVPEPPVPAPPAPVPPIAGDFSVSAVESISIQQGQGKQLQFAFARNNFPDEIALTLKNPPAGLTSDLPKSTLNDQLVATLSVSGAAVGQYVLEFEASAGGKTKSLEVKLEVKPIPPAPTSAITSVALEGFGNSKQVRQGHGNLILKVQGQHLGSIKTATLKASEDGSADALPVSIISKSETEATLQATVKHGAFSGWYDLTVINGNVAQKHAVLLVTYIYTGPSGNDGSGKGTLESPFRSLTKAVSVAESTDRIVMQQGWYSPATGENLPLDVSGKTIQGAGSDKSVLFGTGSASQCLLVTGGAAETNLGDLWVRNCPMSGIKIEAGKATLGQVRSTNNQLSGLLATGSSEVKVLGGVFSQNGTYGLLANGNANVSIEGVMTTTLADNDDAGLGLAANAKLSARNLLLSKNLFGLALSGPGTGATLETSEIRQNNNAGVLISDNQYVSLNKVNILENKTHGIRVTGNTQSLEVVDTKLEKNVADGLNVDVEASETAVVKLTKAKIRENGQSGIEYRSANQASKLSMTASLIEKNTSHGLYIAGQPAGINLNSTGGLNLFHDNGKTHLVDARDVNSGTIKALENLFQSGGGAPFNPSGVKTGPANQLPLWQIINTGNKVDFGVL